MFGKTNKIRQQIFSVRTNLNECSKHEKDLLVNKLKLLGKELKQQNNIKKQFKNMCK